MIGDGATSTRGMITQPAALDSDGVPRICAEHQLFGARARARPYPPLTQGTLHVHLYSASGGINTTGLQVTAAQANALAAGAFGEFIGVLTAPLVERSRRSAAARLRRRHAHAIAPASRSTISRFFPRRSPTTPAWCAPASPIRSGKLRRRQRPALRRRKQRPGGARRLRAARPALFREGTFDLFHAGRRRERARRTGRSAKCRTTVGTPSVDGVDVGEDWAVIADRSGLYIFDGGEPVKISQEIQPLWDTINWAAGHTLWVRVDTRAKRILVGVPHRARHAAQSHSGARLSRPATRPAKSPRCGRSTPAPIRDACSRPASAPQMVALVHRRQLRHAGRTARRHRAVFSRQRRGQRQNLRAERQRSSPTTARPSPATTRRIFCRAWTTSSRCRRARIANCSPI